VCSSDLGRFFPVVLRANRGPSGIVISPGTHLLLRQRHPSLVFLFLDAAGVFGKTAPDSIGQDIPLDGGPLIFEIKFILLF
jgi:hypothetical protein